MLYYCTGCLYPKAPKLHRSFLAHKPCPLRKGGWGGGVIPRLKKSPEQHMVPPWQRQQKDMWHIVHGLLTLPHQVSLLCMHFIGQIKRPAISNFQRSREMQYCPQKAESCKNWDYNINDYHKYQNWRITFLTFYFEIIINS